MMIITRYAGNEGFFVEGSEKSRERERERIIHLPSAALEAR